MKILWSRSPPLVFFLKNNWETEKSICKLDNPCQINNIWQLINIFQPNNNAVRLMTTANGVVDVSKVNQGCFTPFAFLVSWTLVKLDLLNCASLLVFYALYTHFEKPCRMWVVMEGVCFYLPHAALLLRHGTLMPTASSRAVVMSDEMGCASVAALDRGCPSGWGVYKISGFVQAVLVMQL